MNRDVTNPRKGMNRDIHPSDLSEDSYSYALNANYEDLNGESFTMLQNEHSNILCSRFTEGFQVLGIHVDIVKDYVYYFLVNPETNCSEIGRIRSIHSIEMADDISTECGCSVVNQLAEGLEGQAMVETCVYEVLINDCSCGLETTDGERCLNFNINYPISTELKRDKGGDIIYFTDDLNPRRRLELSNLSQYFTKPQTNTSESCGVEEIAVCLNCEKMLVQPPYNVARFKDIKVNVGGFLRHGQYSFVLGYCDKAGNKMTRFMSMSREVSIKDPNKTIYQQPELDARTNLAIKLEVDNLDIRYEFYKVVAIQITSVDGAYSLYEVGVFPTTQNTIIYSNEENLKRANIEEVVYDFPLIKTAKTVEAINNALFFSDLTTQPEVNLQPIANLLGQHIKWRTFIADEDLYSRPEFIRKFRQYSRDEVYPLSIRFFNDEYFTANFPLISRVARYEDLYFGTNEETALDINKENLIGWQIDAYSVLRSNQCNNAERKYKWQFYNTATLDTPNEKLWETLDCGVEVPFKVIPKTLTRFCSDTQTINLQEANGGITSIFIDEFFGLETFTTLSAYIRYLEGIGEQDTLDLLANLNEEITCEEIGCEPNELFPLSCVDVLPELTKSSVEFFGILNEDNLVVEILQECDDNVPEEPNSCYNIKTDSNGENVDLVPKYSKDECDFDSGDTIDDVQNLTWEFLPVIYNNYEFNTGTFNNICKKIRWQTRNIQVWERQESPYGGSSCNTAASIPLNTGVNSTHLVPHFFLTETSDLADIQADPTILGNDIIDDIDAYLTNPLDTYEASTGAQIRKCKNTYELTTPYFFNKLSKNALIYKIENVSPKDWIYFGISEEGGCPTQKKRKDCLSYPTELRVNYYSVNGSCDLTLVNGEFFNREDGYTKCIDLIDMLSIPEEDEDIPVTIYIAVDAPYFFQQESIATWQGEAFELMGYTGATCGCINIEAKNATLKSVTITKLDEAEIVVEKTCEYQKECEVKILGDISCNPIPWDEGEMSYWESTEKYPSNEYLYDSTQLNLNESSLPIGVREVFEEAYVSQITKDGRYIFKEDENGVPLINFSCRPIRHFRFPDEHITPHHDGDLLGGGNAAFNNNKIFPLGFHIDNEVISAYLDVAVTSGLITQEFRDSIKGYELFVGDIRVDQSVLGKGVLVDMFKYQEAGKDVLFPNFPYNQLGSNSLLFQDKERTEPIEYPYDTLKNNRFVFHSPEFSFNKPLVPFETHIKGYELGNSRGKFSEVRNHPTMVLLTTRAERLARALAVTEETIDIAIFGAQQFVIAGAGGISSPVALGLAATATVLRATNAIFNIPIKTFEWTKIIYEFGNPNNFASYYSSEGFYNSFYNNSENGNKLRLNLKSVFLRNGRDRFVENDFTTTITQEEVTINNYNRESSLYLSFGLKDGEETYAFLEHPQQVKNFDNSRFYLGQTGLCSEDEDDKSSPEIVRSIANPYVAVKLYLPAQHGTVDNIQWLSTGYTSFLSDDNKCQATFGGDSFISRFTFKQKFPFFLNPMIDGKNSLGSRTAFNYEEQRNIGYPKFYVKYKTAQASTLIGLQLPPLKSEYNLDCPTVKRMYVKPPSKFYLYYYGIPNFLVESKFNLNMRYGRDSQAENFYPNAKDYIEWTQESSVSIREDNHFYYNNNYSYAYEAGWYTTRKLPFNYDPIQWNLRSDFFDWTVYSIPDNNEQDTIDNWRIFLARNNWKFGSEYGKLIGLKTIESQKALGRFENGIVVFNTANTLAGDVEAVEIGTGNMFTTRPTEFFKSDLGHGGTQHQAFVSSQYGHYWTDAKRGRIYQIGTNGQGLEEISSFGMKQWFRENLPFRIKKQFPNVEVDNAYKGIGISMMWDDRFSRVFITKKDVILKQEYVGQVEYKNGEFYLEDEIIYVQNSDYFIDVSWTVAYSPLTKGWVSFYSFLPNYYVPQMNYFLSGLNFSEDKGVYNHLLTNKSFQVFYGTLYPFEMEYPIQNKYVNKMFGSIKYWLDVKRYHNEYDFANNNQLGFNKAFVFGDSENTGLLKLNRAVQGNMYQQINYPTFNTDSIDILYTAEERKHSFNYMFDNVIDKFNNVPIWLNNPNNVGESLNPQAISYQSRYKNHLKGDWIKVKLVQDVDSRYKFIVKWLEAKNEIDVKM